MELHPCAIIEEPHENILKKMNQKTPHSWKNSKESKTLSDYTQLLEI